jgi:lipopolysaccharide export system permease protein
MVTKGAGALIQIKLIDRYMAKLIFVPLVGTLMLAAMLLVLERMLRLLDFVISEGGPVNVVWRMLANLLPEYVGLGIPLGLMLGILLAFRRIALSSELDTFLAVGLSYGRLLRVPYMYAAALMALNVAIVGFVQPHGRYNYEELRFDLRSGALGASVEVGEFVSLGSGLTVRIERSERDGASLHGVFVRGESEDGRWLAVTADSGTFLATDDPNTILFRLSNGRLVHSAPGYRVPRVLSFASHDLPINLPAVAAFRGRGDGIKELTIPELVRIGWYDETRPARMRANARSNFHFRIAEIAMMLLLPLLAVALAVPPKRSSSGIGIFLAVVAVVTYHKVSQYAEEMGTIGQLDPLIGMWVPFFLFAALIVWMFRTLAFKPGGQPIGALERLFSKAGRLVSRMLPARAARLRPAAAE